MDAGTVTVTLKSEDNPGAPAVSQPDSPLAPWDDPYFAELAHFIRCLDSGEPFKVSPQDGLEAVRLSLAALESIRTGQAIDLDGFWHDQPH
jgi:predicted dehydrogenase